MRGAIQRIDLTALTCLVLVIGPAHIAGQADGTGRDVNPTWDTVQLTVADLTFDAILAGPADGELIVMLHGFPQTSHEFRNQIPVLTDLGYRVLAPDQRGYSPGARPSNVGQYAMEHLVDDVVGMVDALGVEDFHVVGHDWGSVVSWFTAMTYPERVTSVVAISIAHPFAYSQALQSATGEQQQRSAYIQALQAPDAERRLLADDAALLRSAFDGTGIPKSDIDVYLEALSTPAALGAALNWYRALGIGTSRPLTPIRMPTIYVWGTEDRSMSRQGADLTAEYVEGPYRFEILEGVGHWIPEQASDELNRLLTEHFRHR